MSTNSPETAGRGTVSVASAQFSLRAVGGFDEWARRVRYFTRVSSEAGADFVLFPEFFTVPLLSADPQESLRTGMLRLAGRAEEIYDFLSRLARDHRIHLIGGSHPEVEEGQLRNICTLFYPDGRRSRQPKLHITPFEKSTCQIEGGSTLEVFETPAARIGIQICYDVEFPEASRKLAEMGIDILFVPYCTENRQGHLRVTCCARARAIENQLYVVTAGCTGNLMDVPDMDTNYARSAVFTPSDSGFARDGIQAEAEVNQEMLLITKLDIDFLRRAKTSGAVAPMRDRRLDLYSQWNSDSQSGNAE